MVREVHPKIFWLPRPLPARKCTCNYCRSQLVSFLKQLEIRTEYLEATDARVCNCAWLLLLHATMLYNHLMDLCKYVGKIRYQPPKGGCICTSLTTEYILMGIMIDSKKNVVIHTSEASSHCVCVSTLQSMNQT